MAVPGNRLAIPVTTPSIVLSLSGPTGAVSLSSRDDGNGGKLWTAADTLAPGPYTLSYDEPCVREGTLTHREVKVDIAEPSEYPASIGTAKVQEVKVLLEAKGLFGIVALDRDPTFGKFMGLAHQIITVDGRPISDLHIDNDGRQVSMRASCDPDGHPGADRDSCGGVVRVPPGVHRITFQATINGAPADPAPASVDLNLDCALVQDTGNPAPPPPAPTPDPKPQPTPDPPAATPPAGGDLTRGCSVTGAGSASPSALAWGGLALALSVVRRRRRGRS